tara:strand:+ start:726 stop:1136 length:411 start_codon:yes stop_codon:yes gene_type:complete
MRKLITSLTLCVLFTLGVNAQKAGDWYIGTGDIANKAWTEWSVAPTVGYGLTDKLMVGLNVSQTDSISDVKLDIHARYFLDGYFVYAQTTGLNTDDLKVGAGKMFTFHRGVFIDPKVVYDLNNKTINLMLGLGLKF